MAELSLEQLEPAYQTALDSLLAQREPGGHWVGELSSSALSTATAIMALTLVQRARPGEERLAELIQGGLNWLAQHQDDDGGWGDTTVSFSNISTTMLCRAALHLTTATQQFETTLSAADRYMVSCYGATPEEQAEAVRCRYGKDRTFAVPILTTCALAGLVSWREVPALPFELACFPQSWFRFLRLHVVSYALPALIAIGQCVNHHRPPRNPLAWLARRLARRLSLRVLQQIQPENGGFLEATPLTSFVTLSLASIGLADHPVARKGTCFLIESVRADGSWPIDTNLSTWVTTLAINALESANALSTLPGRDRLQSFLVQQQCRERHPYTGAAPGAWAWTPLPGGVPDADDTPGALLALYHLQQTSKARDTGETGVLIPDRVAGMGLLWLLDLQNKDGGWPTFCRGWGLLPFDRSGTDLTAHALRALHVWQDGVSRMTQDTQTPSLARLTADRVQRCTDRGFAYLEKSQRVDGSWLPLWFGNQHAPQEENPTYGTARVLVAYRDLARMSTTPAQRGIAWLLSAQNDDGGWGAGPGTPSSIEETALVVDVLLTIPSARSAVNKALGWLVQQVEQGGLEQPTPIGFYFAKLWYFERLYPIIFCVAALGRARRILSNRLDTLEEPPTS